MKCKTFHTVTPDAYEAGIEISESFVEIQPEVIIFFSSIQYDFPELFEAIYSHSKNEEIIVFGGTANGFYETGGIVDYGISALGINSENKMRWLSFFFRLIFFRLAPFSKCTLKNQSISYRMGLWNLKKQIKINGGKRSSF